MPEDVVDVFVVLGEDLFGEADDGLGGALRCVRPGLCPVVGGHEDASDGLQGEGAVARLRIGAAQRGDRDDDLLGDFHEQRGMAGSAAANSTAASVSPAWTVRR
ncbi:hypothetical protein [Streptomyces sp. NBC_01314]|uniref:hypothetical protein n=1 Tax=Streptomyces sp. NBC_01314 TaxID=2903821 RepID=UPI003093DBD0|nr:hypothetical protein OG622_49325 [Streptomyces sp. NBC_01314]